MGTSQTAGGWPDDGGQDQPVAGPTVLRVLVGTQLRKLREARHVTARDAGYAIRGSHSKISRLESGRTGFKSRDVADLLTFYGVADEAERASLLALARQANTTAWWHAYSDVVEPWFEPYLGLEQDASLIRCYEVQFIPGLLQTEDYARAVIKLGHPEAGEEEIDRRVSLRLRRQQVLRRTEPPQLWTVIDEGALRRPIGGATTLRAQLAHLIEIAQLPNVTIAALPFGAGGHAAAGGPITILRFPQQMIPDMVYLEQLTTAIYLDKQADTDGYRHVLNRLAVKSTQPTETTKLLYDIISTIA